MYGTADIRVQYNQYKHYKMKNPKGQPNTTKPCKRIKDTVLHR